MRSNNINSAQAAGPISCRAKLILALVLPILLALTGCPAGNTPPGSKNDSAKKDEVPSKDANADPKTDSSVRVYRSPDYQFKDRLDAALAVGDGYARDRLLEDIAKDASAAGQTEAAKLALAKMNDEYTRDRLAEEAAMRLAKGGDRTGAIEFAKMIGDSYKRDRVLERVSKGGF